MPDMEKVKALTSILEERSGLGVREALVRYSAEYSPARLKKLVNDGTILSYLTELDRSVAEAIERQVGMMLENDTEYLRAVAVGDLAKARGLENMDRLITREPVYAAMVYV